jgi:ribonucleoside-triphosphate reductase
VRQSNANEIFSFSGLLAKVAEKELVKEAKAVYKRLCPEAIRQHKKLIYIHDFWTSAFIPYCSGWNLHDLVVNGLNLNKRASPARHLDSFLGHCLNQLNAVQQEWAGAMAHPNITAYSAAYIREDKLSAKAVRQAVQKFIYNVNFPTRFASQAPFYNNTINLTCPKMLEGVHAVVGGVEMPFSYDELQGEMDIFNKEYFRVLQHGDHNRESFTFPIPTIEVKEQDTCSSVEAELGELTSRRGSPYFINYFPSYMEETANLSMCCRLRINYGEIQAHSGGTWSPGGNTGSIGVVTINLPRIGLISRDWEDVKENLDRALQLAREYLNAKRKVLEFWFKAGIMPVSKELLKCGFRNHFNTIGIVGAHEFCMNYSRGGRGIVESTSDVLGVLRHVNERLFSFQKEDKVLYNLEQSPAESAAGTLAWHDRQDFGRRAYAAVEQGAVIEYTNSTHVPVDVEDLSLKVHVEEQFHPEFTGGCLCNLFLGGSKDPKKTMVMVDSLARCTNLSYFSLTPTISVCKSCREDFIGNLAGCPKCGGAVTVWSRVTGYYVPIRRMNPAKQAEVERRYLHET